MSVKPRNTTKESKMKPFKSFNGVPQSVLSVLMPPKDMALRAYPIFGGEGEEDPPKQEQTPAKTPAAPKTPAKTPAATPPAGGTELTLEQLQSDPVALSQLLANVSTLTGKASELEAKNQQYQQKEEQTRRASQTKEQNLQTDLDNANIRIERLTEVIKQSALQNAIISNPDYEFHSVRQVLAELSSGDYGNFDVAIDEDGGQAVVTGLDAALKNIASKNTHLVSVDKAAQRGQGPQGTQRPAGPKVTPPANPGGQQQVNKETRRAELASRFSALR